MKGIVFNLLEDVVTQRYGAQVWDELLSSSGLEGAYTSLGGYPDAEMMALVMAASCSLELTPAEVLRWFGQQSMPLLVERYPGFFHSQPSTLPFLLSVNNIIHPEVRKVYPGADVPVFEFQPLADGRLRMIYRSARRLCSLAQGFAEGAAAHYGEELIFEHPECMLRGSERCVFEISFFPLKRVN